MKNVREKGIDYWLLSLLEVGNYKKFCNQLNERFKKIQYKGLRDFVGYMISLKRIWFYYFI